MGSEDKLKSFILEGAVQMNSEDDPYLEFGHGSFGFVVEMRFRGLKCAGKKFFQDLYCHGNVEEREHMINRCYSECLMLCSLSHPNIVQFLGIAMERGSPLPILVMEFLPFTLSSHLKKHGIYPQEISFGILVDVATGLCYLHGRTPAIIHRDLSANNILLTSDMKAKIADLGVAKIVNATPVQSRCPGTLTYMPPEALVENPNYCTEIDRFSYGVLIIHVLCGKWPHPDEPKRQAGNGTLIACSEYERREKYVSMLGSDHQMIQLIKECLSDDLTKRPKAEEILAYVQDVASKCPRKFDSILALLKQLEQLKLQLEREQTTLCDVIAEAQAHYSELEKRLREETANSHACQSELEQTISKAQAYQSELQEKHQMTLRNLNTKAELKHDLLCSELKLCRTGHSRLQHQLEVEKEKYANKVDQFKTINQMKEDAQAELTDNKKLLCLKKVEISNLEKMIEEQGKEIKAKSAELKLQDEQIKLLKVQRTAMEAQLYLKGKEIGDVAHDRVASKQNGFENRREEIKETCMGIELLECKKKTNVISENGISENQPVSEDVKGKSAELVRESREKQIITLEAQIKSISEENEATIKCLQSQMTSLCAQVSCLKKQLETQEQNLATEKTVKEWDRQRAHELYMVKGLTVNLNLELDILKKCQITSLEEEVKEKDGFIQELMLQKERVQTLLCSETQERRFLKFKFKKCPDLPVAMSDAQCAVIEDRVYVGGGNGEEILDHALQSQVFEYNLAERKWNSLCQNHVRFFGLTNFCGKLVSIGGMTSTNYISGNVSVFDFAKNCWNVDDILPSMPTKRFYPTVISHGKYLIVCGGVTQGGSTTDCVEVLINKQWCKASRLPHRICLAKPAVVDYSLYLVGGAISLSPRVPSKAIVSIPISFLVSSPSLSDQNEWKDHKTHICDLSKDDNSIYDPSIANHGGILLVLGGWGHKLGAPTNSVFAYSSEAHMWVKADNLPHLETCYRFTASAQLQNGAIMLIGGINMTNSKSSRVLLMSQRF